MLAEQVIRTIRNLKTMSISALCVTGCLLLTACGGGGGGSATATLDGTASAALASAAVPTSGSLVIAASVPMPTAPSLSGVGGSGATCNPSTAGWPSCTKATILIAGSVPNKVHISGGNLSTPYVLNTPNTEYILDGDITADSTAFSINASYVYLNLNGHTVTYNQTSPGEGVKSGGWNYHDIAIANGSIIQGLAMSEGALYGDGNNAIKTTGYLVSNLQIANIYARIGGRDVAAFMLAGVSPLIENNTIEDTYSYGTLKDRHSGIGILRTSGEYAIIRNNTVVNCRHRGIDISNYAEVYGNDINIRSIATNASGVGGWAVHDVKVYNNTITGRGEHPIGIGFSGPPTTNIEVYNNLIDVQTTRLGTEYGSDPSSCTYSAPCVTDRATGLRLHKEGHNLYVHDNHVTARTDSRYLGTYSVDGSQVWLSTTARAVQIGNPADGSALYENNTIVAMDKDGTGEIGGIVCNTNYAGSALVVRNNTVTSNVTPLVLGDSYGWCQGNPLFIQNTFIKSTDFIAAPNYPQNFRTISSGLGGYYEGTATLISNIYLNGASEADLNMHFENMTNSSSNKNKSIIFGRLMNATIRDTSSVPLANIRLSTYNQFDVKQTEVVTDANGVAQIMVYDREINNAGGTTGSVTPLEVIFKPHTINATDLTTGQNLFTTAPDSSSSAWDFITSTGTFTYNYDSTAGSW